jgi:hypothetical protein
MALCPGIAAQFSEPPALDDAPQLVRILVHWAAAFDDGEIEIGAAPKGATASIYEDISLPGIGTVILETNHMSLLQKLLFKAEDEARVDVAWAVLHLAAAGFTKSLFDPAAVQVRDISHWTLMRMDSDAVWAFLMEAASGEPSRTVPDLQPDAVPPARQAAAIRLLGAGNRDVFRVPLESRLTATDPRIRLAAAEAIGHMRRPESVGVIGRALGSERHPVVAQALVHCLERLLAGDGLDVVVREQSVVSALRALRRAGWRTDMALVGLAAEYPNRGVISPLIDLLESVIDDELVRAVNEHASPRLRQEAWSTLCALTGAILPADQPEAWREFWEAEKDRIEIRKRNKPKTQTRASFFGIPVTGQEIAFVIDTSLSMRKLVDKPADTSRRTRRRFRRRAAPVDNRWSRLDAASDQLMTAVQSMEDTSRYRLITFADEVRRTRRPVRPTPSTRRSLTEALGKLRPNGGTNLYGALFESLGAEQAVFGQQSAYEVDEIFLLSDGEPTAGAVEDKDTILRLVEELNRYQNIRINTVFTGTGVGAEFLRKLAEQNGGVFVQR